MSLFTVVPLAVAAGMSVVVTALHRQLPPALASRALVVSLGAVVIAAASTLWVVSLDFVVHMPRLGHALHDVLARVGVE